MLVARQPSGDSWLIWLVLTVFGAMIATVLRIAFWMVGSFSPAELPPLSIVIGIELAALLIMCVLAYIHFVSMRSRWLSIVVSVIAAINTLTLLTGIYALGAGFYRLMM